MEQSSLARKVVFNPHQTHRCSDPPFARKLFNRTGLEWLEIRRRHTHKKSEGTNKETFVIDIMWGQSLAPDLLDSKTKPPCLVKEKCRNMVLQKCVYLRFLLQGQDLHFSDVRKSNGPLPEAACRSNCVPFCFIFFPTAACNAHHLLPPQTPKMRVWRW